MAPLRVSIAVLVGAALVGAACGGGGGDGGTPPGPTATQIAKNSGDNQVAPAGSALTPLSVIVRDASNNPVQGVSVNWAAASGGGMVSAASSVSDAAGIAAITRTLGPNAGTQTTTATKSGLTGSPLTFTAVAQIQGATQMAVNAGTGQTDTVLATLGTPLSVIVRDQNNAPVQNVTVNWTAAGGSVSAPTSQTNASGIASVTHTLGATAGSQAAQADVTGLIGSPVTFTATATAGNAAVLTKTSGDGGSAVINSMVTYTVTVRDDHNNPKAGVTIDWAVTGGGGTITPAQNTTGSNGQASATRTLSANAGAHAATATAVVIPMTVTFTTTATSAPTTASVTVGPQGSLSFSPNAVTIAVGGTVTWTWGSAVTHNVTFAATAGAPANIGNMSSGSAARQFNSTGTFNYECTIHGPPMTGTVTVQ
ncbi:MAG: Ig-like domain-containing protein [Gemmatimonadetes bacterium]|nr:Ig-like domain-containing protein [Gemmatimonadota bacterium]